MQLTLNTVNYAHVILAYEKDYVQVNQDKLEQSVIVTPHRVIYPWGPTRASDLKVEHFDLIFELQPSIVLLGISTFSNLLKQQTWTQLFQMKQISLEIMSIAAACRTYNILLAENRSVITALVIEK